MPTEEKTYERYLRKLVASFHARKEIQSNASKKIRSKLDKAISLQIEK